MEQHADLNLAERLQRELNSALANTNTGNSGTGYYRTSASYSTGNEGNGIGCTTECKFAPGTTGRSQSELDSIAHEMTNQIVHDLNTGKLQRNQVNAPNWFENRVSEKLSDLQQQHQLEFERNLKSVASRFQQQQQQQSVFSQSQQQQQQGSRFQQQSQSQHNFGYVQPIQPTITGNTYQKVIEERRNEMNANAAYPPPVTVFHGANVLQLSNCTTEDLHGPAFPLFNQQNQHSQHIESTHRSNTGTIVRPVIQGGSNYHITTHIERKEHRVPQVPVVIPSKNSYTHHIEEEQREIRRQPAPAPPAPKPVYHHDVYNYYHESENVPNYKPRVVIDKNTKFHELEVRNRHQEYRPVVTPAPVISSHIKEEERIDRRYHQRPIPTPAPVITTHVKEEEQIDRQFHQRPIPTPAPVITSHIKEEERIDRRYHQRPIPTPAPVITTQVKEEEQIDRQYHQRPIPTPTPVITSHINEEEQIDRRYHQRPIPTPAPVLTTHVKEEEQIDRQFHQRPIPTPAPVITTHVKEEEEIDRQYQQRQPQKPQYPIFSHTTNVQSYNQTTSNQHRQPVYPQPNGQTVTTVKETHYVKILPQPANQYTTTYSEEEYSERLNRIEQELRRLGYGTLSEEEYNATIFSGGFIHNGYKYLYNDDRGRYEKSERVEISEEEYHSLLRRLQNQLQQFGLSQMTEIQFNQTIEDGFFEQNGVRYVFDSETGTYRREEITEEQYTVLRQRIQDEVTRHGWDSLSEQELNQTIATGNLVINGHRYNVNKYTGQLEHSEEIQISEQEYRTILRRLQEQLHHLGFDQMTEREYNQTISNGFFVRNGQKYRYNADIGRYEKIEITEEEYTIIVNKLKETLQRLNYR